MSNMISENGGCGNDESMNGGEELANGNGRTAAERRRSIRSVIASYEAEEEAFLRELAQMQAECCEESATAAATGGSHTTTNSTPAGLSSNEEDVGLAGQEEEEEEPPAMLGTLCTLIGEIAKLRRENRRLKRRIVVPAGSIEADKQQQQHNGASYSIVSGTEAFGHQLKRALAATGQNRLCSLPRRFFPPAGSGGCGIIGGGSSGSSAFSCLPLQSSAGGSANNSSSCCSSSAAVSGLFARQQSRMPPILMGNRRPQQQQQHGGGGSRGAQERLSSPAPSPAALAPHKLTAAGGPSLSVSAYSADLSSDASTFWNRRKPRQQQPGSQQQQHPKLLAEPELFDDEWDLEEAEQQAKSTAIAERSTRGMGRRADEQQQRRTAAAAANGGGQQQDQQQKQLLRLSSSLTTTASGTSPSAGSSASSSVEPPLNGAGLLDSSLMTSSRSSFLELFGLGGAGSRRRQLQQQQQQKKEPSSSPNPFGAAFASAVDSLVARRNRRRRKCVGDGTDAASNRRSAALLFSATGDGEEDGQSPPYSPAHSPYTDGYSSGGIGEQQQQKAAAAAVVGTRMESEPNLHWRRNGSSNSSSQQRLDSRGRRPQSCFLLDPAADDQKQQQRGQADKEAADEDDGSILLRRKSSLSVESMAASRARASRSCRNVAQQNGGQNQQQGRRRGDASGGQQGESAAELRLEMELLKARNARLIEQLREKSSRLSSAEIRQERLARELEQLRRRERFNESVDGLCLRARLALGLERAFGPLEDRLGGQLGAQLQSFKLEAQKQQQMALNAGKQDRQALQEALEQVERLQRQNLSLLQSAAAATAPADLCQSNFELLPSYDALYSFSLGLVKKLGQMRALLAQKCGDEFQAELDLMSSQAQLLLAHAQIERHRLQLELLGGLQKSRRESFSKQRPASFHGDSFLDRLANDRLQLFLPFKLHGQRMLQRKKRHRLGRQDSERRDSGTFDTLVEANEQSIETEFLRLFDSARCLSRICGPSEAAHSHNNSHCAGCASGAAVNSPAGVRRVLASRQQSGSARVGEEAHKMLEESRRCLQRRTQSGGITLSPSAANRSPQMPSASAFHERQSLRRNYQRRLSSSGSGGQHSPALADSPLMKFRRLSAILGGSGFQQQQLHGADAEALATSGGSPLAKRMLMPFAGRQVGSQSQLGSQLGHWLSNMEAGEEETANWSNDANGNCCSATGRRRLTLVGESLE